MYSVYHTIGVDFTDRLHTSPPWSNNNNNSVEIQQTISKDRCISHYGKEFVIKSDEQLIQRARFFVQELIQTTCREQYSIKLRIYPCFSVLPYEDSTFPKDFPQKYCFHHVLHPNIGKDQLVVEINYFFPQITVISKTHHTCLLIQALGVKRIDNFPLS